MEACPGSSVTEIPNNTSTIIHLRICLLHEYILLGFSSHRETPHADQLFLLLSDMLISFGYIYIVVL